MIVSGRGVGTGWGGFHRGRVALGGADHVPLLGSGWDRRGGWGSSRERWDGAGADGWLAGAGPMKGVLRLFLVGFGLGATFLAESHIFLRRFSFFNFSESAKLGNLNFFNNLKNLYIHPNFE